MHHQPPPMRRAQFRMTDDEARAFLRGAPFAHLAGTLDGRPVLKTLNVVELDGAWYFHGAVAGEKTSLMGGPVVLAAEEQVAELPSTFVDHEQACFASVLYRSVQVHGTLERVDEPAHKARALQALMERFQPEGGHRPIRHDDALYAGEVKGVLVARVLPGHIDGKAKLAQNKSPAERRALLEALWRRGLPSDPRAIELVRAANPGVEVPECMRGPPGARLCCAPAPAHLEAAAALLVHDADGRTPAAMGRALARAPAWVGAFDREDALVGAAWHGAHPGMAAPATHVAVRADWRDHGLHDALARLVADHPALRP